MGNEGSKPLTAGSLEVVVDDVRVNLSHTSSKSLGWGDKKPEIFVVLSTESLSTEAPPTNGGYPGSAEAGPVKTAVITKWSDTRTLQIDTECNKLHIAVWERCNAEKTILLHEFKTNPRTPGTVKKLHPKNELSTGEEESDVGASSLVKVDTVEVDITLKPDDALRMQQATCSYMPNIAADIQTLEEHHLGDKVLIEDFLAHVCAENSLDLKTDDLYCVSYFGAVRTDHYRFTPLTDLAKTTLGEHPHDAMVAVTVGGEPFIAMPKAVTVSATVGGTEYQVKCDAAVRLSEFVHHLKEQHQIDVLCAGWMYELEADGPPLFLIPTDNSDGKGMWERVKVKQVYQKLDGQKQNKSLTFREALINIVVPCLSELQNAANCCGELTVSMGFRDVPVQCDKKEALAPKLASMIEGGSCTLYAARGEEMILQSDTLSYEVLEKDFKEGKILALLGRSRGGYSSSLDADEVEEFLKAGDSVAEGFYFTKYVPDDKNMQGAKVLKICGRGRMNVKRIHMTGVEEDSLSDKECAIM
jgi:hypothetical protein